MAERKTVHLAKRSKGHNLRYIRENRQAKSHIRRIKRHLKRHGDTDKVAVKELARYELLL